MDKNAQFFQNDLFQDFTLEYLEEFLKSLKSNLDNAKKEKEKKYSTLGDPALEFIENGTFESFIFIAVKIFEFGILKYLRVYNENIPNDQNLLDEVKKLDNVNLNLLNWEFIKNLKTLRNAITHCDSHFSELKTKDQNKITHLIKTVGDDKLYIDKEKRIILTFEFCSYTLDKVKNLFDKLYLLGFNNFPGRYKQL